MSGLETAIRNALARSDRGDADIRARIYQSARQALEAGLRKQEISDPEVIAAERRRLEAKIGEIEAEERARPEAETPEAVTPVVVSPDPGERRTRSEPAPAVAPARREAVPSSALPPEASLEVGSVSPPSKDPRPDPADAGSPGSIGDLGGMRAERGADRLAADSRGKVQAARPPRGRKAKAAARAAARQEAAPAIPGEKRRRRRRGILSRLFVWFTFLVFIGMGGWWVVTSGLLLTPEQRDTSVPNPPARVEEEDFAGAPAHFDPQRGFSADWLEVFGPDRKPVVTPGSAATAETVAMADGPALKITSAVPNANGEVAIEVPAAILRDLAGKTSTIALTLQSAGDMSVQLAVRCDFPGLGDCSRHRVMATQERSDTLFRVSFAGNLVPNLPGRIYLNSDILNGGSGVLVYSLRVLPGQ
ncbi:hypothetical protein [Rhizobium sp. CSW-27]|uniref:hypothetical protein n=1 Tax=Rhizobium sp. CSW-27 TaxID=2839985 RepID=UPI001C03A325|nr:hypothetical protein [Rhizobium sp. CSW-27]